MKAKEFAKTAAEFDTRFDHGEDIHELTDIAKAKVTRPGKKVRITLDVSETLVRASDRVQ